MAQMNYTYDQFVTDARNAGLYDQFSTADLNLARQNPDKGMQILNFKIDAKNATTPELLALANQGAEDVRKSEGYTGGADGSGFYSFGSTPTGGSFTHTSDSVLQAAKDSGVYDQLSPEDMQLIQNSPDHGMGVVSGKMWAANATTDEEKAFGRNMAEQSRVQGGGYTTNPDGTGYYKTIPSPNDYVAPEAPKYANNRQGEVDDLWNKQKNFADFSYDVKKPTYESQYDDEMQRLLSEILNREAFSYDAESDPLYSQYKKQYLREGERASADALGAAAAMTGGIPSSYAATAAAQAGNHYAAQLTDKIPELYQLAYNQYMNEHQMKLNNLEAVGAMDDRYYGRHLDDVEQWNKDRNFAYGVYGDKYNRLADQLQTARDMEETDYSRYLDDVTQYNKDREFGYKQHTDEIDHQTSEREAALKEAIRQQEYKDAQEEKLYNRTQQEKAYTDERGDIDFEKFYMIMQDLNSEDAADKDYALKLAQTAYEVGDPSLLQALGINPADAPVNGGTPSGGNPQGGTTGGTDDGSGEVPGYTYLQAAYPDKVIPNSALWSLLISSLGSEDRVLEAGFTKGF